MYAQESLAFSRQRRFLRMKLETCMRTFNMFFFRTVMQPVLRTLLSVISHLVLSLFFK